MNLGNTTLSNRTTKKISCIIFVIVTVQCQFDKIWNHMENRPLNTTVCFLDCIN